MKKIYYNKLIRDTVVTKMQNKGVAFKIRKLNQKQFEKALIAKIEEEARGVVRAKNKEELVEELCDLLAVIDEVKKLIDPSKLKKIRKINNKNKGGFKNKVWLVWSADDRYKTNEKK